MTRPTPPRPDKVRELDGTFTYGWIDHRIRMFWDDFSPGEFRLYFFLVTVSNKDGCSWFSSRKIQEILNMSPSSLQKARADLERRNLISSQKDELSGRYIYQVLPLPIERTEPLEIPLRVNVRKPKESELSDEQFNTNLSHISRLKNLLGEA